MTTLPTGSASACSLSPERLPSPLKVLFTHTPNHITYEVAADDDKIVVSWIDQYALRRSVHFQNADMAFAFLETQEKLF